MRCNELYGTKVEEKSHPTCSRGHGCAPSHPPLPAAAERSASTPKNLSPRHGSSDTKAEECRSLDRYEDGENADAHKGAALCAVFSPLRKLPHACTCSLIFSVHNPHLVL